MEGGDGNCSGGSGAGKSWRRRIKALSMAFTWGNALRVLLLLILLAAITTAFLTLPVEKVKFPFPLLYSPVKCALDFAR